MFSFHSRQQSVPLCTQEIWWVILHLCWQWETILLCIEDQNHTHVWAIAKIKNNQPWKETGVIMLSKIIMHINYTAVKGMCLSSLAKASAISVEPISSGILSSMSQRFVFGFALCRTHPFYLSILMRTDFFFLFVGQRSIISTSLHSFQFSWMKGRFIGKREGLGSTLKSSEPSQPYSTVIPTEDPFLRMLNQSDIWLKNPNPCITHISISLHWTQHRAFWLHRQWRSYLFSTPWESIL